MELIGIPFRIVVGERNLDRDMLEYKARRDAASHDIPYEEIVTFLVDKVS
jgi:prolyl-tRNA synthetase